MKQKQSKYFYLLSSAGYSIFRVVQGLFFHPYQTVQFLVKENLFKILIFSPLFILVFLSIIFSFIGKLNILSSFPEIKLFIWYLVKYFSLLWQLVLCYLFFRFWYAWKTKK